MIAAIGMLLSVILTVIANDLILLLLGTQWKETGQILIAFGPAVGMILIYYTNGWIHLSLGRADRWFRWEIMASIATVLCFIIGLPFGTLGVAIAYSLSFYVLTGPALWYAGRPINLSFSLLHALKQQLLGTISLLHTKDKT